MTTPEDLRAIRELMEAVANGMDNAKKHSIDFRIKSREAPEFASVIRALLSAAEQVTGSLPHEESPQAVGFDARVHVPGVWRCAKCNFRLIQSTLNARDGTVTARDAVGDKCPNCDVPMWRVTWREEAEDLMRTEEQTWERGLEAGKRYAAEQGARAEEALSLYEDALSEAEAIFGGEYADNYVPMFALAMRARDARAALPQSPSKVEEG